MVFVADALGAWLVGFLADASRKKLITVVLGSEQQRTLRQAAADSVQGTAEEMSPSGGEQAEQVALVISEVFREAMPEALSAGHATLLEALQAEIARQLAVLDDASLTGTGQSSASVLGVTCSAVAKKLTGHLVREILLRGSRGGPLTPLASQLNHDLTHLQGQRVEGMLAQLVSEVQGALARREIDSQPVRVAPRPQFLAGREDLLASLETRLSGGPGPRVVALCGLGGAGKTSVAVEYAHRQLATTGLVWQFGAEEPAAMVAGFGELAALLGAGDVLAARPGGWLLIFDNAADAAAMAKVLPPAGDGQVIITSQNPHWPGNQAIEVAVLDEDVAADFVMSRTGDHDHPAARQLAKELGGLPLALEQAAAYTLAVGRDIAGYLALYRQRRAEMLARGDPAGYDRRVTTTWSLAFARLQEQAPAAAGLLRLLACCAPDDIPYRLLLQPRPGLLRHLPSESGLALAALLDDPLAVDDAIAALRRYSLIGLPAGGMVSVHRLVQAITLAQLPGQQASAWQEAAVALITAALPGDPQQPASWPTYAALLPHVQAALGGASEPMTDVAAYLGYSGSYVAARDLSQQILGSCQQELGAEHPQTLAACTNLAHWTGAAGDAASARDQFAALLTIRERVLGLEHPSTLAARSSLARWTGEAGDAANARDQYTTLLPISERVLGAEHPSTLLARGNLAYQTGAAGDAASARDQYAALLPIREQVLGPEHPSTLATRANLARWTGMAGNAASARDQYTTLLPVSERVSGAEHPDTLTTRANLAFQTGAAGDAASARDQYAALLPIRERVSGAEHPSTLAARANLARWTGEAGDAASARDQFAALLPISERVLGAEHPDTLTGRTNLASWTGKAGNAASARDQFAALLLIRERVSGAEHPDTLTDRGNLVHWTRQAGSSSTGS